MKSLSLTLTLVALAALACVLACASAEPQGAKFRMPLLPSVEEQRQARQEALRHPNPGLRLQPPAAGLWHGSQNQARPAVPTIRKDAPANKAKPAILFPQKADPKIKAQREPQPDFAGRVEVKLAKPQDGRLRIVNGQKAVLGQFPWQAGILAHFDEGKAWCGGSIIHSRWILTAGHCVDDQATDYQVSVGSLGSEAGSEVTRQVFTGLNTFYQHPAYNPYFIDNDVAIINLPRSIEFSAWCRPVRLPSYTMATDMMVGKTGLVSGWGKSRDSDDWITKDLMYIPNTIADGTACFDYYGNAWIPNKICIQNVDTSFCSGDSGGAFTFEEETDVHTQLGIVSYGSSRGCEGRFPTVYTRVASFLDFIEDTTNIAIRD